MKPASLVCGFFALAALASMVKFGFQPLPGFLFAVSAAAAAVFYRARPSAQPGDTYSD